MFDAALNNEAVSGADLKRSSTRCHFEMSGDHVRHLIVRMAVSDADPASVHAMFGEKELVVVRADKAG
jgi:hypothetical protein